MAFHRHTGKAEVLPGVAGKALCAQRLVNGEEGFANRLLLPLECDLKPQQPAAVTNDGKRAYNQYAGSTAVVAASSIL